MQKLLVLRDFLQNGSIIARKLYARIDPAQRFLRQPAGGRDRARRAWITPDGLFLVAVSKVTSLRLEPRSLNDLS